MTIILKSGSPLPNVIDLDATRAARAAAAPVGVTNFTTCQVAGQSVIVYATSDGRVAAITEADHRRSLLPKARDLPFVSKERNEHGHPLSYWAVDDETAFGDGAFKTGKKWGFEFCDVLRNHGNGSRTIEHVIGALVSDAVRRARKGGKGSRSTFSTAADGFLSSFSLTVGACLMNGETVE